VHFFHETPKLFAQNSEIFSSLLGSPFSLIKGMPLLLLLLLLFVAYTIG
jgi:hypothetical protein